MGTGYTTLDDLENRLDGAIARGEITEHEAWLEMQEAMEAEREAEREAEYEREMQVQYIEQMMEQEPYLFW